jgi:hypothetical protein
MNCGVAALHFLSTPCCLAGKNKSKNTNGMTMGGLKEEKPVPN